MSHASTSSSSTSGTRPMTRSICRDRLQPLGNVHSECFQQCPRSALHGPSPLWRCISMSTIEGPVDTSVSYRSPLTDTDTRWKGSRRVVEGPSLLRDVDLQYPPHLSFWLADLRERDSFFHERFPPYAAHLGSPMMDPLKIAQEPAMDVTNDVDMKSVADRDPGCPPRPNWYCARSDSSRPTCSTLRKPIVNTEAGLRLRYLRIAS